MIAPPTELLVSESSSRAGFSVLDERFVWWLWQTRRFDGPGARAAGHDVIFPGWFSTGAGPDFREAIIADSAGNLRSGDIEIHISDRSWREHGHGSDHAYDNVVLHVVLDINSLDPACTALGREIPVLELRPLLRASLAELLAGARDWQPQIVRCPIHSEGTGDLVDIIRESGARRFGDKVRRMVADVESAGADEALYRSLAEALGYSANRKLFRKLAEALPFALLSSLPILQTERLLLFGAGLSERDGLLTAYIDEPVLKPGELSTFRVRPGNSPSARLRALARLISVHRAGLATSISQTEPRNMWKLFVVEADTVLVGKDRAGDIVINVALPYLTAYENQDGIAALAELPAPSDNRWVRSLRERLAVSGLIIRPYRALHQQGLLELSLRYCRYDHCEACPLHTDSNSGVET